MQHLTVIARKLMKEVIHKAQLKEEIHCWHLYDDMKAAIHNG